ncbi:Uncharacterised protein [Vibrio cholerae]|nr:Uncharacterised protein [Vibrio cholerae]CSC60315.1 Uncharacterised protein [Vibrio cholerae]CSC87002.1 Uncharacterised protein [Vibrio cholerae]
MVSNFWITVTTRCVKTWHSETVGRIETQLFATDDHVRDFAIRNRH